MNCCLFVIRQLPLQFIQAAGQYYSLPFASGENAEKKLGLTADTLEWALMDERIFRA